MKKLSLILTFAFFSLVVISKAEKPIRISSSSLLDEERKVSNFTGIGISGSIKAYVKIGNTESLRLEGDQEAISELITEVKNGVLSIKPKKSRSNWFGKSSNSKITAYITVKKLTSLAMSGSGSIEVENTVNANEFNAAISGSGNIKATVNAQSLEAAISGSGNLTFSGKAKKADVAISGSGSFSGKSLSSDDVNAHISGSGNIYINAEKTINAAIGGSGNVNYTGNPTVTKAIGGSGKVRKAG
ncbi:head GIN domain-containing protein [Pedobacter steynii]|uniref:Putative auto-transporter adhesin head GIN domain-containing protein n=1 Tax=Pedobacter steynii TaxID=430522 RepID=A0A1D7QEC4_9SPHI|nr:head GIN domain-containing protein [Pedobacter steynii]AOM77046.1 hypothetical protein BFS30_07625 [Pedobacter steynii]